MKRARCLMMASVLPLLPLEPAHSAQTAGAVAVANRPIIVASKPFAEGYLLAEIFAQQLEARAVRVTRRFGLGGTEIIFPALVKGDVDLYPTPARAFW